MQADEEGRDDDAGKIDQDPIKQDPSLAMQWWRAAAEQGHADAQYYLGMSLFTGAITIRAITIRAITIRAITIYGHNY